MKYNSYEEMIAKLNSEQFASLPVEEARVIAGDMLNQTSNTTDLMLVMTQPTTKDVAIAALNAIKYTKEVVCESIKTKDDALKYFSTGGFEGKSVSDARETAAAICAKLTNTTQTFDDCADTTAVAAKAKNILSPTLDILSIAKTALSVEEYRRLCIAVARAAGANPEKSPMLTTQDVDEMYKITQYALRHV